MINILLPAMGNSMFFRDYYFPKLMLEVGGETILEKVIGNYEKLKNKHFVFVLNQKDCSEFHIDESAKIITDSDSRVIVLKNQTGGALCTCLLAIEEINTDEPLVIANCDQIIDIDYREVLKYFERENCDAGVITFPSIHPRWSYVRLENEDIIEVSEKRPISKHAIAGFYYFKHGADFIEAAKRTILKGNSLNGKYYISYSLNELILMNKKIYSYAIDKNRYHSFYSPDKIREYEKGR
ncbi:MAG: glycosyltransferase family 2 protein [Phascolarctobacterium sp.]|uniref:glycosyltransferase family 2 protein n=1 Tax=Phascolarctobacterium sp. TaxID=2049039 RepID=UPI0025E3785B|nr:glycosyltransferase family 2 protein [Phascolarctobacterium sp.]MCC8158716.1 glycosyltransferase family 2 protein [Phascolarctobacterium sp.]